MSNPTYEIRERGLQMFWEGNRFDFILRDPKQGFVKATLMFSNIEPSDDCMVLSAKDTVLLDGRPVRAVCRVRDDNTGKIIPSKVGIVWNANPDATPIVLGLTKARNGGKDYFYRGLDTANDRARPTSIQDVFDMFGKPEPEETPDCDDEIPF